MFFNNVLVEVDHFKNGRMEMAPSEMKEKITEIQALTVYPKIVYTENYRTINPVFSYVPIKSIDIFYDSMTVIELVYQDNYREEKKSVYLDPYQKIYTTNKGYISVGNVGITDVPMNNEGRICKIISREKQLVYGDFFTMELKYGNNIMVNGLVAVPK
jgi:hypothetical protein